MSEQFYTILTNIGKAKIANSQVTGIKVDISQMAVGDSNGSYYNPTDSATALRNEVWRGNIGLVDTDPDNPNWIVIETIIPANQGGFSVREVGIFDVDGDIIAIGKYPETFKPVLDSGSAKDLYIRMIIEITNAAAVTLKIDPAVTIASRKYVDDSIVAAITPIAQSITQLQQQVNNNTNAIQTLSDEVDEHLANYATTQNVDYYVNANTGNDNNNGLSSSTAFKTINKAIRMLPKIIDHAVRIYVADGVYNEIPEFRGIVNGKGSLSLIGNSTNPSNVVVTSINAYFNTHRIDIFGFKPTSVNHRGIDLQNNTRITLYNIVINENSGEFGIAISNSNVVITNCQISNRSRAISADIVSNIYSSDNTGANNTFGLVSFTGSTISKNGTQPSATTMENTGSGGVIR